MRFQTSGFFTNQFSKALDYSISALSNISKNREDIHNRRLITSPGGTFSTVSLIILSTLSLITEINLSHASHTSLIHLVDLSRMDTGSMDTTPPSYTSKFLVNKRMSKIGLKQGLIKSLILQHNSSTWYTDGIFVLIAQINPFQLSSKELFEQLYAVAIGNPLQ